MALSSSNGSLWGDTSLPTYARIENGVVPELFETPPGVKIEDCFYPSLVWIEVTDQPQVQPGWTYSGGVFSAPIPPDLTP